MKVTDHCYNHAVNGQDQICLKSVLHLITRIAFCFEGGYSYFVQRLLVLCKL